MNKHLRIDFVSDVSCPWCIIGLNALQQALQNLDGEVSAELHFQPFELNPGMPPGGQDLDEHLRQKYGLPPEQQEQNREAIRARGEQVGFTFRMDKRTRIYNTFDAHRLLHWAELEGRQLELKRALFEAYFSEGENPAAHDVLMRLAEKVGLNPVRAAQILASGEYADDVREKQRFYLSNGINSVPSVIINERHLIQGGHPYEVYEQALREIAESA